MNKLLRYLLLICVVVLYGGASYGQTKETYTFSQFTTSDKVTLTGTHCTITLTKGKNNSPAWNAKSSEARVYAGGSLIVDSKKLITKVVYTFISNKGTFGSVTPNGYNQTTKTWESSTGSNQITFTIGELQETMDLKSWKSLILMMAQVRHQQLCLLVKVSMAKLTTVL